MAQKYIQNTHEWNLHLYINKQYLYTIYVYINLLIHALKLFIIHLYADLFIYPYWLHIHVLCATYSYPIIHILSKTFISIPSHNLFHIFTWSELCLETLIILIGVLTSISHCNLFKCFQLKGNIVAPNDWSHRPL